MSTLYNKPCPFCGSTRIGIGTSYDFDGSNTTWKYVECGGCGVRTRGKWFSGTNDCPIFYEEVRQGWNREPADKPAQGLDDVREILDIMDATVTAHDQENGQQHSNLYHDLTSCTAQIRALLGGAGDL